MDANADRQEVGLTALRSLLTPTNLFIIRDERIHDYGVDLALEIRLDTSPTNHRIHVQLKSWTVTPNRDGSYSVEVAPANLNYLLNTELAAYILYENDSRRLFFVWADEEFKRLESVNPHWRQQSTITIRLRDELIDSTVRKIHERSLKVAGAGRQLRDILAVAKMGQVVNVSFHALDRAIVDPDVIAAELETQGLELISEGYHGEVQQRISELPSHIRERPSISLINSYALFRRCEFAAAAAAIAPLLASKRLAPADHGYAEEIFETCRYQLGQISYDEYKNFREHLAGSLGQRGATQEFEFLRMAALESLRNRDSTKLVELQTMVNTTATRLGASSPLTLHFRLACLFVQGVQNRLALDDAIAAELMRQRVNFRWTSANVATFKTVVHNFSNWLHAIVAVRDDALTAQQPLYVGESYRLLAFANSMMLQSTKARQAFFGMKSTLTRNDADQVLQDSENAKVWFERASYREGSLSASITAAEALFCVGCEDEALAIANDVLRASRLYFYANISSRAQDIIDGKATWRPQKTKSSGVMSADRVEMFVDMIFKTMDLSAERRVNLKDEIAGMSLNAAYQSCFCEHMQLLFEQGHAENRQTAYAKPVTAICMCKRFGFRTPEPGSSASNAIHTLLYSKCLACEHKTPKC